RRPPATRLAREVVDLGPLELHLVAFAEGADLALGDQPLEAVLVDVQLTKDLVERVELAALGLGHGRLRSWFVVGPSLRRRARGSRRARWRRCWRPTCPRRSSAPRARGSPRSG